jgi:hypothetical protein
LESHGGKPEPPAVLLLLEGVRHEGIEVERLAVLAQQPHFLDADGPRDLAIAVTVGVRQRRRVI